MGALDGAMGDMELIFAYVATHSFEGGRAGSAVKNRKQILLLEERIEDIELTLAALDEHNLAGEVAVVCSGVEALDYLLCRGKFATRSAVNPAVMLLNLQIPPTGGLSVLREIKTHPQLRRIPVVVLTSSAERHDLEASYELGANAYIVKPGEFCQFIEAIKQVGAFWTGLNEVPARSDQRAQIPPKVKSNRNRRSWTQSEAA